MASGKVYVCSKMASDNAYTTWHSGVKAANDMPRKDRQVLIKGGSGVINKQLVTLHGVVTQITAEELELVRKSCPAFIRHEKAGFLKVLQKDPSPKEIDFMSKDMPEDKSKQKKPGDIKKKK
ncbi:hypothetical protein KAT92_04850 [Candidatus Babeliales bacterium]|nr:hypothetical protein [Candidatus Babeliales bacterium]